MADRGGLGALGAWIQERYAPWASAPLALVLCGSAAPGAGWPLRAATAAAGWLLLLAARAWDDLADLPRDLVRRPGRLLCTGRIQPRLLAGAASAAAAVGLVAACWLDLPAGLVAGGAVGAALLGRSLARAGAPLAGLLLANLPFPALVLLGALGPGGDRAAGVLLALLAWTAAASHDLAHGIEDEAPMPAPLRDPLPPGLRARAGAALFAASLLPAAAHLALRPSLPFAAALAVSAAIVAPRLAALVRVPSPERALRLRVPGFLHVVLPLAGALAASLAG